MHKNKIVCKQCNVRIPANRPKLKCNSCNEIKHFRCENLTKSDAMRIIDNRAQAKSWWCLNCTKDLLQELPAGACVSEGRVRRAEPRFSIKCHACNG